MFILKFKKFFIALSASVVIASFVVIGMYGLKLGIEFTGGSVLEFTLKDNTPESTVRDRLTSAYGQGFILQQTDKGFSLKIKTEGDGITHNLHVINVLSDNKPDTIEVQKFDTISPTLGNELKNKALFALALALACITVFIAYAFRKVSTPVSSWKYGFITMIALVHDIVITIGVFALLGHTIGLEVDALFLTALLVILGYSINDTIVVFDRIRENLSHVSENKRKGEFEQIVGNSLSQTFVRSINTTMTTVMSATILFILTEGNIHYFALAMIIGMASGAYSSLFVASPLLAFFNKTEKA
jgi:preprotein translocase subunit SecF